MAVLERSSSREVSLVSILDVLELVEMTDDEVFVVEDDDMADTPNIGIWLVLLDCDS